MRRLGRESFFFFFSQRVSIFFDVESCSSQIGEIPPGQGNISKLVQGVGIGLKIVITLQIVGVVAFQFLSMANE